ncbi:MAG TPA: ABC transporter ATP-binding protein [Pyrinomonadaceae bacterium]|nr:ABC transporter ATP-binding protein [Pyrinomonadaceae bacterium]
MKPETIMQSGLEIQSQNVGAAPALLSNVGAAPVVISLDHVHKTYTMGDVEVHALRGISLQIKQGEFVAIMGASGSGKSTTMNIIGCLDRPTKGTYILDSQDLSRLSKDQRADIRNHKLGFVFQGFNLLSRTSALENVELPMLYAGVETSERHRRSLAALAAVGLAGRERNHPNQLSGGQQQRVAIARALVNEPALILADEPTGNLDSRTSVEVMEIFQRLNRERHMTLILVTHEPDIADYADRVVVFKDGRIKSDYQIESPRNAAEELKLLTAVEFDEDDDDSEPVNGQAVEQKES